MSKSPPKRLDIQSKQKSNTHRQDIAKLPNNHPQQSSHNTEATGVNNIMEKLDNSDQNWHGRNTNINQFSLLFESNDEEGTKSMTKPKKIPVVVLSEDEDEDKKKG